MKKISFLVITLLLLILAGSASAQALTLDHLLKLSTLPTDVPLNRLTSVLFPPKWTYRGHVGQTGEVYWTINTADEEEPSAPDVETATSWVSLRPMPNNGLDVLLKTEERYVLESIRKELKRLKYAAIPVTCLECEGERYTGPAYTVTLYTGKKGHFPFVVVLHQQPAEPTAPAPPAEPLATPNSLPTSTDAATSTLVGQSLQP